MTDGNGGRCAVALIIATYWLFPVTIGNHSNPFPLVSTSMGTDPSVATRATCLRSISSLSLPVLAANTSHFPSKLIVICSAIKLPGVSNTAFPPPAGTAYKCGHPSWYERKTMRSLAAQCRLTPPCVVGKEPRMVAGAFHNMLASPVATVTVHNCHGTACLTSIESGLPPVPGVRTKVSCFPLGDHCGVRSRLYDGAIHSSGAALSVYTPTRL